MTSELLNKWTDALESGEYPQTRGRLYLSKKVCEEQSYLDTPIGYCCLGVLSEVAGIEISEDGSECMIESKEVGYDPLESLIGPSVSLRSLYDLNDRLRKTFPEIAQWIRENIKPTD